MAGDDSKATFVIVFAAGFAVLYLLAVENNWALFTYHPALEQFGLGVEARKDGPAMYWYGWLATAGFGAALCAGLAALLHRGDLTKRIGGYLSCGVPLLVMAAFVYVLRRFFLR